MKRYIDGIILNVALLLLVESAVFAKPFIPLEKNIDKNWVNSLFLKGERKTYKGDELKYIAMPCGGIGCGEVDVTGDGKLCFTESIYNVLQRPNNGHSFANGYNYLHPEILKSKVSNIFKIKIGDDDFIPLDASGFDDIKFIGEYPMAFIQYENKDNDLPVNIMSEVFSSFIPTDVRRSANPFVAVKYIITNKTNSPLDVSISSTLENIIKSKNLKADYRADEFSTAKIKGIHLYLKATNKDAINDESFGGLTLSTFDKNSNCIIANDDIQANIVSSLKIGKMQSAEVIFIITWYYPNLRNYQNDYLRGANKSHPYVGRIYKNWYKSALDVADYVGNNFDNLYSATKLYHDTYFDNSLPYWLSSKIAKPLSTLSAGNISIYENGCLYGYEGIGFCPGNCGHVYNFVPTTAKLFPSLERAVRVLQDFNPNCAFAKSGRINFRGYDANNPNVWHAYASDAQSGYVLKVYREHLMSRDNSFLNSLWQKVKMAIGYQIFKDGAEIGLPPNGVLEGKQTFWDPMWYGPNPYNNGLYLASLRAAEEMAYIQHEDELAKRYHLLYESGRKYMSEEMWNGDYYIHLYPYGFGRGVSPDNGFILPPESEKNAIKSINAFNNLKPTYYRSAACDANQLFGQNWANQLDLGYILPKKQCEKAAENVFKYNWTPDIYTVYKEEKPKNRTLADKGEAAMVNAGWGTEKPMPFENTHDKSDVWTGLEYEASCDMINEGQLKNAFVVIKSVDDRYNAIKRNPWNEVEGSNHYARAMHAWNILLALSGNTYDGPKGILKFNPVINPNDFKSFFSVAEGWGSYAQKCDARNIEYSLDVKYGNLILNKLVLPNLASATYKCFLNGNELDSKFEINKSKICVNFDNLCLKASDILTIEGTKSKGYIGKVKSNYRLSKSYTLKK